jgi:hypothetical protein
MVECIDKMIWDFDAGLTNNFDVEGHLILAGYLLGLFLDPEDGGSTFLRNVSELLSNYTVLHPRREYSS